MVRSPVRGNNSRALASELLPVQADKLNYNCFFTFIDIELAYYEIVILCLNFRFLTRLE